MKLILIIILSSFSFDVESLILDCSFSHKSYKPKMSSELLSFYSCFSTNINIIDSESQSITNVTGVHLDGYSNANVTLLDLMGNDCSHFPKNFSTFFPSVTFIIIHVKLKEIKRNDFGQFKLLKLIYFVIMVDKLDADIFEYNHEIEEIEIINSIKPTSIHPQLIESLPKIKYFYLKDLGSELLYIVGFSLPMFWDMIGEKFAYPDTVYCAYGYRKIDCIEDKNYACTVQKILTGPNDASNKNPKVYGYHKFNKTDEDVVEVNIEYYMKKVFFLTTLVKNSKILKFFELEETLI